MGNNKQHVLLSITVFLLFGALIFAPAAMAEEFGDTSNYRITGFSFDTDAVFESDSGLQIESSRFKPLMITNSASDILAGDPLTPQISETAPHGFAIAAEYLATPSLAFHGAIGVTKATLDSDISLPNESSWEANIGVVYNFFNSLAYEIHFGYMDAGDIFKQSNTYSDVDSIIMISNQLSMSF